MVSLRRTTDSRPSAEVVPQQRVGCASAVLAPRTVEWLKWWCALLCATHNQPDIQLDRTAFCRCQFSHSCRITDHVRHQCESGGWARPYGQRSSSGIVVGRRRSCNSLGANDTPCSADELARMPSVVQQSLCGPISVHLHLLTEDRPISPLVGSREARPFPAVIGATVSPGRQGS